MELTPIPRNSPLRSPCRHCGRRDWRAAESGGEAHWHCGNCNRPPEVGLAVWHFKSPGELMAAAGASSPGPRKWCGSESILDALDIAQTPWLCLVELRGELAMTTDGMSATDGVQLTDYADASRVLAKFASEAAERAAAITHHRGRFRRVAADAIAIDAIRRLAMLAVDRGHSQNGVRHVAGVARLASLILGEGAEAERSVQEQLLDKAARDLLGVKA